jgi:hypothetical protein
MQAHAGASHAGRSRDRNGIDASKKNAPFNAKTARVIDALRQVISNDIDILISISFDAKLAADATWPGHLHPHDSGNWGVTWIIRRRFKSKHR